MRLDHYMPALSLAAIIAVGCASQRTDTKGNTQPPPGKPAICAVESPELCLQDGIDLYNGLRAQPDRDAAIGKFELSCAGGDQRGCTWLGIALSETSTSGPEQSRAVNLWEEACAKDVMMACTQLGARLMALGWQRLEEIGEDSADKTFQAANVRLKRACGASDEEVDEDLWGISVRGYACGLLASSYEHGFGVEQDPSLALDLNGRSCKLGWARSCAQVGYFYDEGVHGEAEPERAAMFYRDACDRRDPMGCHHLALLHLEGRGVQPDPQEAVRLLRQACEQDYSESCEKLETLPDTP